MKEYLPLKFSLTKMVILLPTNQTRERQRPPEPQAPLQLRKENGSLLQELPVLQMCKPLRRVSYFQKNIVNSEF